MSTLVQIVIYPLQRLAVLLFSMQVADGISIGALMVAACLLMVIFKALVGIHLSVFNNGDHHKSYIGSPKKNNKLSNDEYTDYLMRNYNG